MGYFVFTNNTTHIPFDSRELKIEISEAPKVIKPQRRAEVFPVPGRSGNVIVPQDAWEDVTITYHCWKECPYYGSFPVYPSYCTSIAERLQSDGYAELYDSYTRQTRMAYLSNVIEYDVTQERIISFDLVFTCRPQIYLNDAFDPITIPTDQPLRLYNGYGHDANPLFRFSGAGTLTITYEGQYENGHYRTQTITVTADSSANDVYLDCETGAMYTLSEYNNKYRTDAIQVSGVDLPVLRNYDAVRLQWSNPDNPAYIIPRWWQL